MVTPAADLPRAAKERGARLVIIDRDPTPLGAIADTIPREPVGKVLAEIDAAIGV